MIEMVKYDEQGYVPKECCTMTNPATSGGKSVPDDVQMPCEGAECCTGECSKCIIQKLMNEYANYKQDIREKVQELKDRVPVNRITDNIIKDKPKELGMLIAYENVIKMIDSMEEVKI